MADILSRIHKQAGLSQTEVAERIGLSRKSYPYISYLESGKIKNPSLASIVLYIRACGGSLVEFFKDFDVIDFKLRHEKMISQLISGVGLWNITKRCLGIAQHLC